MVTLAWLVQGILYPAFKHIPEERFTEYHAWYTRRITWFVGPLMVLQVVLHAYQITTGDLDPVRLAAAIGVLATWGITGLGAVPIHSRLTRHGYDEATVDRLLRVNLIRTLVWTAILVSWIPVLAG